MSVLLGLSMVYFFVRDVWQFSEIGQSKKYEVKGHPVAPFYEEKMSFF